MSTVRWWVVGVLVVAVLGVVAWQVTDDSVRPLNAELTGTHPEVSDDYRYPVWATGDRTPIELARVGDELKLLDPAADSMGEPPEKITLPGGGGTRPQAVATLPGHTDGPWVAVARKQSEEDSNDPAATDRPLVWNGQRLGSVEPAKATDATELPVDLITHESDGADTAIDAAVARLDGQDIAVVAAHQNEKIKDPDISAFLVCRLDDCRWRPGAVPRSTLPDAIGSTGDGLVAVATSYPSERADIWYADDADLTWRRIGSAPRHATLQLVRDGRGGVTLVWERSEGDEVAVQTVRDGRLRTAVPFAEFNGEMAAVNTALNVDGHWYLGGSRPSTARLDLPYSETEPVLWEMQDHTWEPLDDALLSHQIGQVIEVMYVDRKADLRAVSSSPGTNTSMTWRFTREAE